MQTLPSQIRLQNSFLELVFEPQFGGKWRSLMDCRTQREWFWRNPHLPVDDLSAAEQPEVLEPNATVGWHLNISLIGSEGLK